MSEQSLPPKQETKPGEPFESGENTARKMDSQADTTAEAVLEEKETGRTERAEYLAELAKSLFDQTRWLHGLDKNRRELLAQAARLESLLALRRIEGDVQAIRKFVEGKTGAELSLDDQELLVDLLSLPKGKVKRRDILSFELSTDRQQELLTLFALLRTAISLDASNSGTTHLQRIEQTPEGPWIVVEGPMAKEDAEAAQANKGLWKRAGLPGTLVLTVEQAEGRQMTYLPLPQPMDSSGLQADDPMAEAGRKILRYHFAEMLRHEAGTRLGEDIEALHDMRVATRRMRAAFEIFEQAFAPGVLKPYLKGLRLTGRALGRVRDLDVFMEKAQLYLETLPEKERNGLDPLLETWRSQREQARAEMIAHLNSDPYHKFKWDFNTFLSTPGAGARQPVQGQPEPYRVRELAPVLIYTRLAAVRAHDQVLDNATIEQYHALRIEFKKLRYTVEFFREVLGEEAKAVINELKKLQDHLGDMNDADVASHLLQQFLAEWELSQANQPVSERLNPEPIAHYLATRLDERHRLMVSFSETWEKFNRPSFRQKLALAVSVL